MPAVIGAKIQIDGEKEYRQAISNITQQQKTLQAELKATQSAYDSNTSAEKKKADATKNLKAQIALQEEALRRMKEQVDKSTKAAGENATQTQKLRQQYANATTKLNEMKKAVDEQTTSTEALSTTTETSTQTFGGLIEQFGLAAAATKALKSGFDSLGDTIGKLDDLATEAAQSGLGTDTIQAINYASDQIDVSSDTIIGAMRKMTQAMSSAPEKFAELGVSVTDANGQMRGTEEVFFDVVKAMSQIGNETERDQVAMSIFGKSANDLAGIIDDGGQSFQAYAQQASDLGLILSDQLIGNVLESGDAIATAKSAWEQAKDMWNAQLLEAFAPVIQGVAEAAIGLASAFAQLPEPVKVVASTVLAAGAAFVALSKGIAALQTVSALSGALTGLSAGMSGVGTAAAAAGAGLQVATPAVGAAGSAFTAAAPGMLAFGGAVALIGAGIGAAAAGVGYLVSSIASFGEASAQLAANGDAAVAAVINIDSAMSSSTSGVVAFNAAMSAGISTAGQYASALQQVAAAMSSIGSGKSAVPDLLSGRGGRTSWHANATYNGRILRGATIFGAIGGKLQGAGEAGSEVVVGAASLASMISHSVRTAMVPSLAAAGNTTYGGNTINVYSQPGQNISELADLVSDRINYSVQRRLNGRR